MQNFWQQPLFILFAAVIVLTTANSAMTQHSFNPTLLFALLCWMFAQRTQRKQWLYTALFFLLIALLTMPFLHGILLILLLIAGVYAALTYSRAHAKTKLTSLHYTSHQALAQPPQEDYVWRDYIVQRPFGIINIDATKTILPTGTSFISVRHGIGKIIVTVPFEVGLRIQASTLLGSTTILDEPRRTLNEVVMYEEGLHLQRIIVLHLSSIAGEIEVIRQ
ncbi:cell wall-active antibiotics response protein LiaF [Caryophanon tenue]|uniref:Cell wall-active antibiotics response LiaF-like C-terminal domain-containing protein n=1 Tax=Caryophanon tenue TaxID=33978 RepID=A0A1C0YJ71_9BACL|nr:cell wall-active antibiotics response protein LiaF [Caryophanon tenue]OCS87225.1 hypothetical protein A6M13_11380 [Caryophanon tenue]